MASGKDLATFYKGKKVFITGHTGFKGSWLTQIMLHLGAEVTGYALAPHTSPSLFEALKLEEEITHHEADTRDLGKLKAAVQEAQPDIIFHLAAQPIVRESYDDPMTTIQTNTLGTTNLVEAARDVKSLKAVVVITTDKVYQNNEWVWPYREQDALGGDDPYSASKAAAEIITRAHALSFFKACDATVSTTRAGNVIGGGDWSRDRLVPDIVRAVLERKESVPIRNPEAIRPWQHVLEPLSGYITLAMEVYASEDAWHGAWNFGPDSGSFVTVRKVVELSRPVLGEGVTMTDAQDPDRKAKHEAHNLTIDSTKARQLLRWEPQLDIARTVGWTMEWYSAYYASPEDAKNKTVEQIEKYLELME